MEYLVAVMLGVVLVTLMVLSAHGLGAIARGADQQKEVAPPAEQPGSIPLHSSHAEARERLDWGVNRCARELGVHTNTVHRAEAGKYSAAYLERAMGTAMRAWATGREPTIALNRPGRPLSKKMSPLALEHARCRKTLGRYSLDVLSKKTGISVAHIRGVEAGDPPSMLYILAVAKVSPAFAAWAQDATDAKNGG